MNVSGDVLNAEELRDQIEKISTADLLRLRQAARLYASNLMIEAPELVNHAILKALDGTRLCPREVPIIVFLVGVIRSTASALRQHVKHHPAPLSLSATNDGPAIIEPASIARNVEESLIARQEYEAQLKALEELFGDDEEAQLVILCDRDGLPADQIRAELSITELQLATIRRRIRRRINAQFPRGWQS